MTARHGMGVESVTARHERDTDLANDVLLSQIWNGNEWEAFRAIAVMDWLLALRSSDYFAAKWSHIADAQARVEQLAEERAS